MAFFPVAFPLKIIPPECAWEKQPERAHVTEGAAREMLNFFFKELHVSELQGAVCK